MTLLANLGLVYGIAATIAANSVRLSKHERARALRGPSSAVAGGIESATVTSPGVVDVPAPDPEDPAVEPVACSPTS
jgi:hypothetical protein